MLLLDQSDRVLLIRVVVTRAGREVIFWVTPGGTVEEGETDQQAARREIAEELGLDVSLAGPVHTTHDRFDHEGHLVDNIDVFFVGRCTAEAPKLAGTTTEERNTMKAIRWWANDEIARSTETIFPTDLASVVERL